MKNIQISKVLFISSNLFILLAFNRNITFGFFIDYFIKIFLFIFLFKKFNTNQFKFIFIASILGLCEILISYIFDTHNPNFLTCASIISFLIYKTIFRDINEKQLLLNSFSTISLFLCLPLFTPSSLMSEGVDGIIIQRNVSIYILGIFLNLATLNLSKIITNIKNYNRTLFTALYLFLISSLGLFISFKYYFASLGGIINLFSSTVCLLLLNLYLLSKYKLFKLILIPSLITFSFIFISSNYLNELIKLADSIWSFNNDVQGSILSSSPRTDLKGFFNCFLDYPLGTGFYGLEKLCDDGRVTSNDGIRPHSAIVSFLLAYPLIAIFILFLFLKKDNLRKNLFSQFIFSLPQKNNLNIMGFIVVAKYIQTLNFFSIILISELIFKFPLF